jgi:hypothetical protein
MACRDYEYEKWLQQAAVLFDNLMQLLSLLCQTAEQKGLEMPRPVARWWQQRKRRRGKALPITQENLDKLAQLLCLLCQAVEEKGLEMPPPVAAWWQEHRAEDEAMRRSGAEESG